MIAPNTPIWKPGWHAWQAANEVPELTTSALSAQNGVVPNIPPPPLAVLAVQHAFEAKSGSDSFGPSNPSNHEPPPPPPYVPVASKSQPEPTPPPPVSSNPRAGLAPSLPTTIGLPPPPEVLALVAAKKAAQASGQQVAAPQAAAPHEAAPQAPPRRTPSQAPPLPPKNPMIEELSGSMLLDENGPSFDGSSGPSPTVPVAAPVFDMGSAEPAAHEPSLSGTEEDFAGLPPRRPNLTLIFEDLKEIRAGRPPKNKLLIGVIGALGFSVVILLLALIVSAFRGNPSELPSANASASASGSSVASASPPSRANGASAVTPPEPKAAAAREPAPSFGACSVSGESKVVSPRAMVASGIEAFPTASGVALAFASQSREGMVLTLDPSSLATSATARTKAGGDIRRVSPNLTNAKITAIADFDKKGDKIAGRRTVATTPPVDIGVADNAIVWVAHNQGSWAKLFLLDGEGPVEALRAVPLGKTPGIALAFRRGGAIYFGIAKGEGALTPEGQLGHIAGLGQVGAPAITISGDNVIVAWSDRAGAQDPWQVRWAKAAIGGSPGDASTLALPVGGLGTQAMSPAVAGLGGGRFMIAWTEGPVSSHQVRALVMNADGSVSGAPLAISADGVNAGQPQAVVGPDGRGVVAFLGAKAKGFELYATPIACTAK
ncbi:Basic proline-rich protein [Labilithrix luteola]|uniref:Basic proline-rich protein n=1 Tax=Labilithrix luteola TaxID=1391654 RepID=A0A0K1PQS2_9BACT|nr:Basic proline-rich protein [Labilithrix luteola]